MCQLLASSIKSSAEQFNAITDFGGVEHRLSVSRPYGYVAAAIMVVGYIEELSDSSIPAAIRQFFQVCSICFDDVRMAVVVFA